MRVLSLNFRQALFAQEGDEIPVFLVTITHETLATPIYLTTDPTTQLTSDPPSYGTNSRSNTYLYAGIEIAIPDEQDKSPPASKLTIENVTRGLIPLARSVNTPPKVTIEAVLASDPDTVESTWPDFDMSNLQANAMQLVFDLTVDSLISEPYPSGTFSPAYFPGLFY